MLNDGDQLLGLVGVHDALSVLMGWIKIIWVNLHLELADEVPEGVFAGDFGLVSMFYMGDLSLRKC